MRPASRAPDGPALSAAVSSSDVLASPFPCAATAAALSDLPGRSSDSTSAGGAWKPCQVVRLGRGRGPLARGHAALHARQAGLLQDAKPRQGVPTTGAAFAQPTRLHSFSCMRDCASQVFESSSDHSSRYTPVSEGTKAWVADSFIDGQPMSSRRRGMKRRAALTYNLTGDAPSKHDPSSSSGTTFKPTARRPFDCLPEHLLDVAEEDDE